MPPALHAQNYPPLRQVQAPIPAFQFRAPVAPSNPWGSPKPTPPAPGLQPQSFAQQGAARAARPTQQPPSAAAVPSDSASDLRLVCEFAAIVNGGEIAVLARKLRSAQSPFDKVVAATEHATLLNALNALNCA